MRVADENEFSSRHASEDWAKPHERESRAFECMSVRSVRLIQEQTFMSNLKTVKRKELLVVILDWITNFFNESLILAQDERWRRA